MLLCMRWAQTWPELTSRTNTWHDTQADLINDLIKRIFNQGLGHLKVDGLFTLKQEEDGTTEQNFAV